MTVELWISEELHERLRRAAGSDGSREATLRSCIDERLGGSSVVERFEPTKRENCFRAHVALEPDALRALDERATMMMVDEAARVADAPTKFYGRAWSLDQEVRAALTDRGF